MQGSCGYQVIIMDKEYDCEPSSSNFSELLGGLVETQIASPIFRVSDSVGLGWDLRL